MTALMDSLEAIKAFMDAGGEVLTLIAILTFVMWTLIFERLWYFKGGLKKDVQGALDNWESRKERKSWNAHQVRYALISRVSEKVNSNLDMVATLVMLAPLFGLLGTVWGMIEVFNVLAVTGGGDAKSMAGGVSKATIPTMAGMVAALSGVFGNTYITRIAERENQLLEDHLTMDH
ncbi:MotA/TolQ/ExbB proton channel family protein [Maricurvus nonylphenolicus]|uniref:MotA/TolQ/ExbB proton channel family protein n=1 Tax=Maricurvus nonylphenolicus TaxID=1008307 RepID=UPI0036F3DD8A